MLDSDLAKLYHVEAKALNQAVKRDMKRFPPVFMFQLYSKEFANLKSQIVTSNWGGMRKLPFAFIREGIAMLSGVLKGDIAIEANIRIVRVYVLTRKPHYPCQNMLFSPVWAPIPPFWCQNCLSTAAWRGHRPKVWTGGHVFSRFSILPSQIWGRRPHSDVPGLGMQGTSRFFS